MELGKEERIFARTPVAKSGDPGFIFIWGGILRTLMKPSLWKQRMMDIRQQQLLSFSSPGCRWFWLKLLESIGWRGETGGMEYIPI